LFEYLKLVGEDLMAAALQSTLKETSERIQAATTHRGQQRWTSAERRSALHRAPDVC
jgi:hypothetical protein